MLILIPVVNGCCAAATIFLFALVWLQLFLSSCSKLIVITKWGNLENVIRYLNRLRIILSEFHGASTPATFHLQASALIFYVATSFVVIGLRNTVPTVLWVGFLVTGITASINTALMMPLAVNVYEHTIVLLHEAKNSMARYRYVRKKFSARRLKSIQTCKMFSGVSGFNFYYNSKSTLCTLFYATLDKIITAILF